MSQAGRHGGAALPAAGRALPSRPPTALSALCLWKDLHRPVKPVGAPDILCDMQAVAVSVDACTVESCRER